MDVPYAPEIVAEWLGWTPAQVRERFKSDVVMVRRTCSGIELRPGPLTPDVLWARTAAIIEAARPREAQTLQNADSVRFT